IERQRGAPAPDDALSARGQGPELRGSLPRVEERLLASPEQLEPPLARQRDSGRADDLARVPAHVVPEHDPAVRVTARVDARRVPQGGASLVVPALPDQLPAPARPPESDRRPGASDEHPLQIVLARILIVDPQTVAAFASIAFTFHVAPSL